MTSFNMTKTHSIGDMTTGIKALKRWLMTRDIFI